MKSSTTDPFPHQQHYLPNEQEKTGFIVTPNIIRTDHDLIVKDFFIANDIETITRIGQKVQRVSVTGANGTIYARYTDYILGVTSLVTATQIVLPKPLLAGIGKVYVIKDESGGAGSTTITITSAGEELIDGASSSTITSSYGSKTYYTDAANWFTI